MMLLRDLTVVYCPDDLHTSAQDYCLLSWGNFGKCWTIDDYHDRIQHARHLPVRVFLVSSTMAVLDSSNLSQPVALPGG
ncbi:hypothetical protein INT44_001589 [Umbelopsis vinacea]|uniref:Uncharacterized protein n=1 Tax=Umbelopsis vinacea TaxID=44442 RepID=A0A8H7PQH7_9FUNG|nr:hypothetical protein INT44_001589 [Umbelopsis vinacea]